MIKVLQASASHRGEFVEIGQVENLFDLSPNVSVDLAQSRVNQMVWKRSQLYIVVWSRESNGEVRHYQAQMPIGSIEHRIAESVLNRYHKQGIIVLENLIELELA